eukprot:scaffold18670_cov78-Skeletonema_dohrnii-CCMP3373.AAC.3
MSTEVDAEADEITDPQSEHVANEVHDDTQKESYPANEFACSMKESYVHAVHRLGYNTYACSYRQRRSIR